MSTEDVGYSQIAETVATGTAAGYRDQFPNVDPNLLKLALLHAALDTATEIRRQLEGPPPVSSTPAP